MDWKISGRTRPRPAARTLALWILGPFLMALINLMIVFWLNLQSARAGVRPRQQAFILVAFSLAYILSSLLAGRWTRPERAARQMKLSVVVMSALATLAFLSARFESLVELSFLSGLAAGQYFGPFQVRIGNVKPFPDLAWCIACYNLSWGVGDFLGPLVIGVLRGFTPAWLIGLAWLIASIHVALIESEERGPGGVEADPARPEFASTLRLRVLGWMASMGGLALYSGIGGTLYPGLGVARGWNDLQIAAGVAVLALPIPLTAPLWALLSPRLRRPWLLLAATVVSAASVAALPQARAWPSTLLCMAGLGLGYSAICFHSIYYVNADAEQPARSIGINEAVFGLAAVVGPLGLGLLAWEDFEDTMPYAAAACAVLAAAAIMAVLWLARPRETPAKCSDSAARN